MRAPTDCEIEKALSCQEWAVSGGGWHDDTLKFALRVSSSTSFMAMVEKMFGWLCEITKSKPEDLGEHAKTMLLSLMVSCVMAGVSLRESMVVGDWERAMEEDGGKP